jgi:orotidine-5'-phosphate decarboxylase
VTTTVANPLVVALDTVDLGELAGLAALLGPAVGALKVGLQAFLAHGPRAVEVALEHGPVFLDVKLHDIPNTVAGAAAAAADLGVSLLTVHASGGPAMLRAAVEAAPGVTVLAVSVLTSMSEADLAAVGQPHAADQVVRLARLAREAGAGGLVCAPTDVAAVRAALGAGLLLVTPGVRPGGEVEGDDQARTSTPSEAVANGADLVVVGRPVTRAADPLAAAGAILADLEGVRR